MFLVNGHYTGVGYSGAAKALAIASIAQIQGGSIVLNYEEPSFEPQGPNLVDPFRVLGFEDLLYEILDVEGSLFDDYFSTYPE